MNKLKNTINSVELTHRNLYDKMVSRYKLAGKSSTGVSLGLLSLTCNKLDDVTTYYDSIRIIQECSPYFEIEPAAIDAYAKMLGCKNAIGDSDIFAKLFKKVFIDQKNKCSITRSCAMILIRIIDILDFEEGTKFGLCLLNLYLSSISQPLIPYVIKDSERFKFAVNCKQVDKLETIIRLEQLEMYSSFIQ